MSFFVSESIKNVFDESILVDQFSEDDNLYSDHDQSFPISLKTGSVLLDVDSIDLTSKKLTLTIDQASNALYSVLNKSIDIKVSLFGNSTLHLKNVTLHFESCKKLTSNLLLVEICIIENSELIP